MKTRLFSLALLFLPAAFVFAGSEPVVELSTRPTDENSHDIFSTEGTYTFTSDFKEPRMGEGNSLHSDFSYDHRFLIRGNWYFKAGLEYERFDFDGTDNGLPDHLQAAYSHLALE